MPIEHRAMLLERIGVRHRCAPFFADSALLFQHFPIYET